MHNLLFAGVLFWHGRHHEIKSSSWLGGFVLLAALYIAPFMLGYSGWYGTGWKRNILFYVPFQQLFLLPPILLMYTKTLLTPDYKANRTDLLLFIPAILYNFYVLVVWIVDKVIASEIYFYTDGKDMDFDPWYQVIGFIYLFSIAIVSIREYARYKRMTVEIYSYADTILYRWFPRFVVTLILLLFIRLCFFITNPEWANFGSKYWYYICFSVLVYYISIRGYIHAVQLGQMSRWVRRNKEASSSAFERTPKNTSSFEINVVLKEQIEQLMSEEKLFLKDDLTLFDLASALGVTPKEISFTINKGFEANFNDFINAHRVQEVIERMKTTDMTLKSILGIAYDCGFNSKSTFHRAFKKFTGSTPNTYMKEKK